MQGIDLGSALILIANAPCEAELAVETVFQSGVACDLAVNVADVSALI
jgi:hypothetical protein